MGGPARFPTMPLVALALVAAVATLLLLASGSSGLAPDTEGPWEQPEWPVLPSDADGAG